LWDIEKIRDYNPIFFISHEVGRSKSKGEKTRMAEQLP
jgi:hypothetical protein